MYVVDMALFYIVDMTKLSVVNMALFYIVRMAK